MKRLLLAGLAFVAVAGPAAADLARPIKRRPVVVAPVYGWTGVYIGGNLGYSWGNARTDIAGNATFVALPTFFGGIPDNRVAFADSNTARLNGVIGGGQIGYNYQFSPRWVLGFEADIQASGGRRQ
jgi:outer membrane immunogenic protein